MFSVSFTSLIKSFNSLSLSIDICFSISRLLIASRIEDSSVVTLSNSITNWPSLVIFKLSLLSNVSCTNFSTFSVKSFILVSIEDISLFISFLLASIEMSTISATCSAWFKTFILDASDKTFKGWDV